MLSDDNGAREVWEKKLDSNVKLKLDKTGLHVFKPACTSSRLKVVVLRLHRQQQSQVLATLFVNEQVGVAGVNGEFNQTFAEAQQFGFFRQARNL